MAEHFSTASMWLPLLIFGARVADVSIGTLRLICIVRGHKPLAVVLSFAEVLIWIFAITNVLSHLDRPLNLLAFAAGYATGSAVGMWLENRLAFGMQVVTFVTQGSVDCVAERLVQAGHMVTALEGRNHHGPVALCHAILPRKQALAAVQMAREVDSEVVATVEDLRTTTIDHVPTLGPGNLRLPWRGLTLGRVTEEEEATSTVPDPAKWKECLTKHAFVRPALGIPVGGNVAIRKGHTDESG